MLNRIVIFILLPIIGFFQSPNNNHSKNNIIGDILKKTINERNFQLEEIKVRWRKASLENCPFVSCVTCGASSASSTPTVTQNAAMTNITHTTTIATGIGTATGLPSGVSANWSSNTITISGTPTASGTFNYTIPLTGTSCSTVTATGTITVIADCAAGAASSSPTLSVNTTLTNITHTTTSATGIGIATGLPTGVNAAWASNTITISGTPTATGIFNYSIPLIGTGCGSVNATGTITVNVTAFICGTNSVLDIDNNTYNTVLIGTQCWTKENLRVSHFRNGDPIPIVTDDTPWSNLTSGARSWYDNDSTTYENSYGNLYNWNAGSDSRGICPIGWHVPTLPDAQNLINFLGGFTIAGGKLKEVGTTYWYDSFNGNVGATNESGFSARGGGTRNSGGSFTVLRQIGFFWTTTENYEFDCFNNGIGTGISNVSFKTIGYSIRCIKD